MTPLEDGTADKLVAVEKGWYAVKSQPEMKERIAREIAEWDAAEAVD